MGKRARWRARETPQARAVALQSHFVPASTSRAFAGGIRACMRLLTDKESEGGSFLCFKVPFQITPDEMAEVLAEVSDIMSIYQAER